MTMPDGRPDPDVLLANIHKEQRVGRGRLLVFLGMCPGVGKTYAMLQMAHQRRAEGVDVIVGVIETHGREETAALLHELEQVPLQEIEHRGQLMAEMDLDAILARQPSLVLVDELAHSNVPGARHLKRYLDVLELLEAGIDVYTTVNVQHIASQIDTVQQITGVTVQETIPDFLLDQADEIQLVDLSVEKIRDRLADGKVYQGKRAQLAVDGFFREGNLTALRELALRFTAEHVDRDLVDIRRSGRVVTPWKTNARLLVGVGSSPYAESLIRWTRRAAMRLGCPWLVVWVEGSSLPSSEGQDRLARSLTLARQLGAEVLSVTSDDVAHALLEVARERNVTQIVVGKPAQMGWLRHRMVDRLVRESGDIDVCLVRPTLTRMGKSHKREHASAERHSATGAEYQRAIIWNLILGIIAWVLSPWTGYAFAALVFLFGIVLAALKLSRGPVLLVATLSALTWNFLFIPPIFSLTIQKSQDMVIFGMFFVVALSMGHLTARLRQREIAERRRQRQTVALLRVTQSAALEAEFDKGLKVALDVINELLGARTCLMLRQSDHTLASVAHAASTFQPDEKEHGVVAWAFDHRQVAGRDTSTLPRSQATWYPLQTSTSIMGVLGVLLPADVSLDFTMKQTTEALAMQLALVLEKEHFIEAASRAEVLEASDRLRQSLLDSVSHELKIPLAVIRAALEGMAGSGGTYADEIATATARLQRIVDGLLQMTRLESCALKPQMDWCDVHDVIATARELVGAALEKRDVRIEIDEDFPLVRLDHQLLAQALANVLHNAVIYTQEPLPVTLSVTWNDGQLAIRVRDFGKGVPEGEEKRVFEKFYRIAGSPPGGTGLGLAIARGFVRSQGGDLSVRNHPDGGAELIFLMKVESMSATITDDWNPSTP